MPFPTPTLLDDFNRSDGSPGANWLQGVSGYSVPNIVSNRLDWPTFPSACWSGVFGADQFAWCQLVGGASAVYFLLRWTDRNSGSEDGYAVYGANGGLGPAEAWRYVNGTPTSLGFANGIMAASDTYMGATIVGSAIEMYGSEDGSTWNLRQTWSDGAISTTGLIGIFHANNVDGGAIEQFGGGEIVTTVGPKLRTVRSTQRW